MKLNIVIFNSIRLPFYFHIYGAIEKKKNGYRTQNIKIQYTSSVGLPKKPQATL